jgi:hypothetical protein
MTAKSNFNGSATNFDFRPLVQTSSGIMIS